MYRIRLFDPDALVLSPRWAELGPLLQAILLGGLCLVPLLLVVWLYSYELKLLSGRLAAGLLALRAVTLALILFLVCLEPVYSRSETREVPGRVVVAVDRSASMAIADKQRSPLDALRLARSLRLSDEPLLDDWIVQHASGQPPEWTRPDEFRDAAERERVAGQRRQAHDALVERVNAMPRRELVARLLGPEGAKFLDRLGSRHAVELVVFDRNSRWGEPGEWEDLLGVPDQAEASRLSTDLVLPLAESQERSRRRSGKVLGVVLLTDGRHNLPGSPVKLAQELGQRGIPVCPVAVGDRKAPADVAVVAVTGPTNTFKGVDAPVEVRFRVTGMPAGPLRVLLHRPGQERHPIDERTVEHDGKDREYTERFTVRMDEVGRQTLVATVRATDPAGRETLADNNGGAHTVRVADDRARVLLVDGEARWEYHYLATALQRDPTIKLRPVVFTQPRIRAVGEDDLALIDHPSLQLPAEADALTHFECVVLGDVTAEQLPRAERERLEKWVADQGGTLIVVAGKRAMPLAYLGEAGDPLARLLPIEQGRAFKPEDGFQLALTEEGRQAQYLQLADRAEKSQTIWKGLPKAYWAVPGKAKPGAVVLASVAGDGQPLPAREARQREQDNALIARHNYGFGRVVYVGVDSTWRWRWREGDTHHHRFWGQVLRWAASDRTLPTGNQHVRFGTPEPVYRMDEPVKVLVRLGESIVTVPAKLDARARIFEEGKEKGRPVAVVPLERSDRQPRLLEAQLTQLPPGRYTVELSIPDLADRLHAPPGPDGESGTMRAAFAVEPPEHGEKVELAANFPLLEELAARGGGKVYTLDQADELLDRFESQTLTHTDQHETRLWQWWVTLVLVVGLLTVEWVARKLAGLP